MSRSSRKSGYVDQNALMRQLFDSVMRIGRLCDIEAEAQIDRGAVTHRLAGIRTPAQSDSAWDCFEAVRDDGTRGRYLIREEECSDAQVSRPVAAKRAQVAAMDECRSPAALAQDRIASTASRINGLRGWIDSDGDAASVFIESELDRPMGGFDPVWLDAVILATEHVRFADCERQARVGRSLLDWADHLRERTRPGLEAVVWCALHRGGSLIPTAEADRLRTFLTNRGPIDTRLAALQAIVRIFEAESTSKAGQFASLTSRIDNLVDRHLNADVFRPGEIAALVLEGMIALALLDPVAFERHRLAAVELKQPWFERMQDRRLRELPDFVIQAIHTARQ